MLVSHTHYIWFITIAAIALGGGWMIVDIFRLRRALSEDRSDPFVRDRIFGSVIGILICVVGVYGAVSYHL